MAFYKLIYCIPVEASSNGLQRATCNKTINYVFWLETVHPGAKKNSVTAHFVNLFFPRFYRTTSLPGRLVPRSDLELTRVSAGKKKEFSSEEWVF